MTSSKIQQLPNCFLLILPLPSGAVSGSDKGIPQDRRRMRNWPMASTRRPPGLKCDRRKEGQRDTSLVTGLKAVHVIMFQALSPERDTQRPRGLVEAGGACRESGWDGREDKAPRVQPDLEEIPRTFTLKPHFP